MSLLISTKNNTIKIYDDFDNFNLENSHYSIIITIKELKYEDGNYYYDIAYTYNFIKSNKKSDESNNKLKIILHPFYGNNMCKDSSDGDIVFKNELTTKMVEYLLMDDNELVEKTGLTSTQRYRINIMNSLALFWD